VFECDRCRLAPILNRPQDDLQRPNDRIRTTKSKKTGCQFSVNGVQVDKYRWKVRHRPEAKFGVHNHPLSCSALAHAAYKQLDKEQV
jgi:hypothetical protein